MEEKQKNKKKLFSKERVIVLLIGLVAGILLTGLTGYFMDCFGVKSVANVAGKTITARKIYEKAKKTNGVTLLMNEIDKTILNEKYSLTDKEKEEAKKQADYYLKYNESMGYSQEEFLSGYGFANYEEFLEDVEIGQKSNKYLYDYLEGKLETGAVKKYYDEHKDEVETYDSEHILVKISDDVTDEQALALANEIIGKLNEGKKFEEVVEEYGDKIVHEELGFQGKTASLEQPYIDELVALEDGEYSKTPVKTSYGYHIVHRLATATFEELRGTIIETLSADLLSADSNLTSKAFVELRKENNLKIFDEDLNKQYQDYCDNLYTTEE